jgi:hypothetical protein
VLGKVGRTPTAFSRNHARVWPCLSSAPYVAGEIGGQLDKAGQLRTVRPLLKAHEVAVYFLSISGGKLVANLEN